jgi:hypothetical protein
MMRMGIAIVIIALIAGPAAAQNSKRSKRRSRPARQSKTVKPDVTTPAPAPEPEALRPAAKADPAKPAPKPGDAARRESRIEFDERMVQGQTAAGAIYLFQRADAAFSSMIAAPESFRERTVRTVYVDGVPGAAGASP